MSDAAVSRRALVFGGAALLSGVAAAACGAAEQGATGQGQATGSPAKLLAWVGPPVDTIGPGADFWKTTEGLLKDAFPNLQLDRNRPAIPEKQTFDDMLIANMAAGSGPDVWEGDVTPWRQEVKVKLGIPMSLESYYARLPNLKRIFGWMKEQARIQGKLYGVPHEVEFIANFYNKPVFAASNVRPGTTWEEFLRAGETLKSVGVQPLNQRASSNMGHLWSLVLAAAVGKQGVDDIVAGKGRWDGPGPVLAGETIVDLQKRGVLPRYAAIVGTQPYAEFPMGDSFFEGKVAQWVTGTWSIAGFETQKRERGGLFDYDFAPLPSPNNSRKPELAGSAGGGFSIWSKSKVPDVAAPFVDWLYSPPVQKAWIEILFQVPPVPFKVEDYTLAEGQRRALALIRDYENLGFGWNVDVVMPEEMHKEFWPLLSEVNLGAKTPREMMTRLQQLWETEQAKLKAR
jgi:ABC-type glycerol-3-phosphate transport system substrate-binding protein